MVVDLLRCGADGSDGWRLCLATNGSLFGVGPFTKLIGFDLRKAAAHGTGGRYGRGLPVPMPVKVPGSCPRLVLSPRHIIKCKNDFYHVKMPENDSFH